MARREQKNRNKGSSGNNRKISEDFLLNNAKKEGVIETNSGLQYSIIEKIDAQFANEWSTFTIHQRVLLLNGTVLGDTYRKNEHEIVKFEELIEGLQEGILLMTKGSRFKFWVPPELAWGKKGTGNSIPPYAVLVFDIRLVDFS